MVDFEIIRDAKLLDCIMTTDETSISSVCVRVFPVQNSVMGPKDITVDCGCLLLCGNYECDTDIFSAVNDAGLIYDGGIVVNEVASLGALFYNACLVLSQCRSAYICRWRLYEVFAEIYGPDPS